MLEETGISHAAGRNDPVWQNVLEYGDGASRATRSPLHGCRASFGDLLVETNDRC